MVIPFPFCTMLYDGENVDEPKADEPKTEEPKTETPTETPAA